MKPKEKAKELMENMHDSFCDIVEIERDKTYEDIAKQCALTCVEEIISSGLNLVDYKIYSGDITNCLNYWQEVKKEIEKLLI